MTLNERMEVIDNLNTMWIAFASVANPYVDAAAIMAVVQAKDRIHTILSQDGAASNYAYCSSGKCERKEE